MSKRNRDPIGVACGVVLILLGLIMSMMGLTWPLWAPLALIGLVGGADSAMLKERN